MGDQAVFNVSSMHRTDTPITSENIVAMKKLKFNTFMLCPFKIQ